MAGDAHIELMMRVKNGDKSAFEELYHLYSQPLGNFFYRMSGSKSIAEDCLQEVFYRIWLYRENYQPQAKVITYLFHIAKNYWINEGKKLRRVIPFTTFAGSRDENSAPDFPGDKTAPDEEAMSNEVKDSIKEALRKLSEKERIVVVMSMYQKLPYSEIAEILGIAEITVKTRMTKALERLKKPLGKYLQ
ncbi:MAG: RNA polymerase sigma factor [Planctomycetes bacterium]|nr:RNA polymerase sigma factor [Planctomycetota bacterium]